MAEIETKSRMNCNMADVWANSMACYPRATCHTAGCKNSILHIEIVFRHIFCFLNAVWALTSGGFRIVYDTLFWDTVTVEAMWRMMTENESTARMATYCKTSLRLNNVWTVSSDGQAAFYGEATPSSTVHNHEQNVRTHNGRPQYKTTNHLIFFATSNLCPGAFTRTR